MGAKLNFYGNEVQIIFADGTESMFYELKEDAIHAIIDCYKKRKITKRELIDFRDKIFFSKMHSIEKNSNFYKKVREAIFFMHTLLPTEAQKN